MPDQRFDGHIVGYAVSSPVTSYGLKQCPDCPVKPTGAPYRDFCSQPPRPRCHARCIYDPRELAAHVDCQEYERSMQAWKEAHTHEYREGGTRISAMHFFRDCERMRRGEKRRRSDARVLELTAEVAQTLQLELCSLCRDRMLPFEQQMKGGEIHARPTSRG